MSRALQDMIATLQTESRHRFTVAEINQFAGCLDNSEFFNEIGLEIAAKYQAGELSYTVCDGLLNDLWRAMLDGLPKSGGSVAEPFYSIYLAFDAGEYFHKKIHRTIRSRITPIHRSRTFCAGTVRAAWVKN